MIKEPAREKRVTLIFDTKNEKQMEMYEKLKNLANSEFRSLPNLIISKLIPLIEDKNEETEKNK